MAQRTSESRGRSGGLQRLLGGAGAGPLRARGPHQPPALAGALQASRQRRSSRFWCGLWLKRREHRPCPAPQPTRRRRRRRRRRRSCRSVCVAQHALPQPPLDGSSERLRNKSFSTAGRALPPLTQQPSLNRHSAAAGGSPPLLRGGQLARAPACLCCPAWARLAPRNLQAAPPCAASPAAAARSSTPKQGRRAAQSCKL